MKILTLTAVLLTVPLSFGQDKKSKPPQAPPVVVEVTSGGTGVVLDVANKTATVPADWSVVVKPVAVPAKSAPKSAPTPAVVVTAPFGTVLTTPATTAPLAVGASTSRSVGLELTRTRTAAATTAPFGGTTTGVFLGSGCANGQCGAVDRPFGVAWRPFGIFRR